MPEGQLHKFFVINAVHEFSLRALYAHKWSFKYLRYSFKAIHTTFRKASFPSSNIQEGKYFNGKPKLYFFRKEVSVRQNCISVSCNKRHQALVSDLNILQNMIGFHEASLKKIDGEDGYEEGEISSQNYFYM